HEGGGERTEQAEQQDAKRQSRRDLGMAPAELAFERHDHHARRSHRRSRHQQSEKRDRDHHPSVMDVAASGSRRADSQLSVLSSPLSASAAVLPSWLRIWAMKASSSSSLSSFSLESVN